MRSSLIVFSIPIFFLLIGVEVWIARRKRQKLYRFQDSINSLSCGVAQQATDVALKFWNFGTYIFLYEALALYEFSETSPWVWIAGMLGVDLAYYWYHRVSHRVNFVWAAHVVHHQSEEFNLTTALRQSALQGPLGMVFYWPLAVLGLPPIVFFTAKTLNTLYQFWIHTRLIGRLGPLELVLNTPSNHRVHHGIDPKYIDKNYGGILIVWDRLFGSYAKEEEEPAYGTVKPLKSWNPIWANLEYFARMAEMARTTKRFWDKLLVIVAPPEWRPADLGGKVEIPPVNHATRVLYEQPSRPGMGLYVGVQFAIVAGAIVRVLTTFESAPAAQTAVLAAWVVAALLAWGGLFERRRWGLPLEAARLIAAPAIALWLAVGAAAPIAWGLASWALLSLASAGWLFALSRRWPSTLEPATV